MSLSMTTLLLDAMFESWFVDALNRAGSSPSILDCLHKDKIHVTWCFKAIGGFGAAIGFFLCGFRVTQPLGGKLTYMSNSRGLAAQLSTVAAIILVTQIQLLVSTIHALIGSLVGVGIADDPRNVNWKLLFKFICGWVMIIIFCSGVSYVIFIVSIHSPAYVVR